MKPFKIAVMYGSQTGNAQSIAEGVHDGCQKRGLESTLLKCDAWKKMDPELKEWGALVLIVSTTGNGDPPENSERFWRFIKRRTQPKDLLTGLPFALLGLGDTNYDKFCYMGKSFDKRLKELGAAPFHAPAFADEATNMEETIEPWLAGLFSSLESLRDQGGANNAEEKPPQAVAEGGLEEASQAAQTPGVANGQPSPSGVDTTGRGEEENGEQAAPAPAKTRGSSATGAGTVAESRSAPALATTPPTNGSGGGPSGAARDSTAAAETKAPPTPQQPPTAAAAAAATAGDTGGEALLKAAAGGGGSEAVVAPGGSEPLPTHRIAVMYGSQTGNAKSIAEGIHDGCKERGLVSTLLGCDGWKKMSPELKEWSALVIIVSTTGNGDAPENTERFWRFLKRRTQPKDLLQGLPFALLGLGDTNYDKFCYMGKSLDKRFRELGATPVHPPAFADEATNMEETIEPWLALLYPALTASIVGAAGGVNAAGGAGAEGAAAAAAAVPTKAAVGSPAPAAAAAAAGSEDAVKEAIKGAAAEAFQLPPDTAAATAAAGTTAKNVAGTNGGGSGNAAGADSTAKNVSGPNGAPAVSTAAAAVTVAAASPPPASVEAAAAGLADLTLSDDGASTATAASSVVEPGPAPTPPGEQTSGSSSSSSSSNSNNTTTNNNNNNNGDSNGNSGGDGDASPVGRPPPQQPWSPRAESGARPLPDFLAPGHLEPGYSPARSDLPRARPSAADVRFHVSSAAPEVGEADEEQPWLRRARQRSSSVESRHTLDWPFSARVKSARYLTEGGRGADRRVINMELSLRGSGITYVPGDVIGFRCPNRAADTAYLLERLQDTLPEGAGPDVPFQHSLRSLPSPCTLRDALSTRLDLQAPLRRPVLRALAEFCGDPAERSWMELLCSKTAGAGVYASYVAAQSLTLCELLEAFPSCKPRPGALLALLPPLPPRYYSVASSQLATPDSLTVAFSVASSRLPHAPATATGDAGAAAAAASPAGGGGGAADGAGGGDGGGVVTRRGLCTNWLEGILAPFLEGSGSGEGGKSVSVPVFLKPTKEFLLPASAKWPCVLIGPGTGVSPFIGFLKHREEQHARRREEADAVCSGYWRGGYEISLEGEDDETAAYRGREGRGDMLLFFGCRNGSQDWIFRREMEGFLERGTLSKLHTAFSRDASEKVYVQHRIREHGAELSRLMLQQGAYVYVCGDGNAMAQGVHRALVEALVEHGGAAVEGEKEAEATLRMMKDKKRYVLDVWS